MGSPLHQLRRVLSTIGLAVVLSLASVAVAGNGPEAASLSQPFDASKEFPNYLLPSEFRGKPASEIPLEVLHGQRELVEKALGSVFERLVVPIVPRDESEVRQVRYFPYLREHLRQIDPDARIYASGGVVRTAISYLYDEVRQALLRDPRRDPSSVLKEIASSQEDLPAIKVRGIGSDFDLLVDSPRGQFNQLQARAMAITNSAYQAFDSGKSEVTKNLAVKSTFFTLGDIRDYGEQIERSTRQGGTVVDYLAFDVGSKKLRDPPRFPGASDQLIAGHFQFAAPKPGFSPEDTADTVIRGARTLLELPWLKLDNEEDYQAQVDALLQRVRSGQSISPRALGQFAKGVRNSRYFGAHNRFYRAQPGSPEGAVLELSRALGSSSGKRTPLLPEFVDSHPISLRSGDHSELNGLPRELLTPLSAFKKRLGPNGVVYHGTPSMDQGLAILRQGLFLSKDSQGNAAYGRGAYSSPDRSVALSYARDQGMIFELKVKDDPRVNILDWERVKDHPVIRQVIEKARRQGRDVFEYLSREHGIDVIVNHHVLIQNSDAFVLPAGLRPMAQSIADSITAGQGVSGRSIAELIKMDEYLVRLGEKPVWTEEFSKGAILRLLDRLYLPPPELPGGLLGRLIFGKPVQDRPRRDPDTAEALKIYFSGPATEEKKQLLGLYIKKLASVQDLDSVMGEILSLPQWADQVDLQAYALEKGGMHVVDRLAAYAFRAPMTPEKEALLQHCLQMNSQGFYNALAKNMGNYAHLRKRRDLIQYLIEHGDQQTLNALLEYTFPYSPAVSMTDLLTKLIEKSGTQTRTNIITGAIRPDLESLYKLTKYFRDMTFKPEMREPLKALIEKDDPDVLHSLLQGFFLGPDAESQLDLLERAIELVPPEDVERMNRPFSVPIAPYAGVWKQDRYDYLRKALKIPDPAARKAWIEGHRPKDLIPLGCADQYRAL